MEQQTYQNSSNKPQKYEIVHLNEFNMVQRFPADMLIRVDGDIKEVINRATTYSIILLISYNDYMPTYICIDVPKNDTSLTSADWNMLLKIRPIMSGSFDVVQDKEFNHYRLKKILKLNFDHTIITYQYCGTYDHFIELKSGHSNIQCCDNHNNSNCQATQHPMSTRTKVLAARDKNFIEYVMFMDKSTKVIFPICPENSDKIFYLKDFVTSYLPGAASMICNECNIVHSIIELRDSDDSETIYKYCYINNRLYDTIDTSHRNHDADNEESETNEKKTEETMRIEDFGSLDLGKAQAIIDNCKKQNISAGDISDGYHTFNELYHHRALLFASLCMTTFSNKAWKSLLHDDPANPMYPGMFIVGVETPEGQATYHYDIDPYWSMFKNIKEVDRAPKYDGHTPEEAIQRIYNFAIKIATTPVTRTIDNTWGDLIVPCSDGNTNLNARSITETGPTPEAKY